MEGLSARSSPKGEPNHAARLLAFLTQSGELGKGNWKVIITYSYICRKPLVKGINTSLLYIGNNRNRFGRSVVEIQSARPHVRLLESGLT